MPLQTRPMNSSWRYRESFCHSARIVKSSMKSCVLWALWVATSCPMLSMILSSFGDNTHCTVIGDTLLVVDLSY